MRSAITRLLTVSRRRADASENHLPIMTPIRGAGMAKVGDRNIILIYFERDRRYADSALRRHERDSGQYRRYD